MSTTAANSILSTEMVNRKLRRMAFEIAENNEGENAIILAGINGNGEVVARCLQRELQNITRTKIELVTIRLNKKDPLEVTIDATIDFTNKIIIIVDDVANSGKTMAYALKPFLSFKPKKVQALVLVERSHKLFPVQADYVGLTIATTLQEYISVEVEGEKIVGAYLG
jgi:pyrimidine operon attenuation protein/uracil phosphoribosyltransferase